MITRVTKKMVTPFESCDSSGAVLMINLFDPQIPTARLFIEAINQHQLPYLVLGNKRDLVSAQEIDNIQAALGEKLHPISLLKEQNTHQLHDMVQSSFPSGSRVVVLGIFNSGKTSLISHLIQQPLKIGPIPGTTLEFDEYPWQGRVLIDSIGQVIDVNRPLMVGYDFSGLESPRDMFVHAMRQDAEGILSSIDDALKGMLPALDALHDRLQMGGKIVITGAGASALVAEEIAGQFFETGITCIPITNHMSQAQPVSFAKGVAEEEGGLARYICDCASSQDVLIGVSASGGTGFVYEALRRAREKGVLTIALTENRDTPLGASADIVIKSNAKPEGPSSTRIQTTHLAIGHALVCVLAAMRGLTADQSISYMLPESVATKKMGIK